jgi:AraC-like DNA-binding protein
MACDAVGTEHLALSLGIRTALDELGPYGRLIRQSATVHEYLSKGISLYNLLITGQRFWLSEHGDEFRLNLTTAGDPSLGAYQSHIESVVSSIANLRQSLGPGWSPGEISFAYCSREELPVCDVFGNSRLLRGNGKTYITVPRAMMGMPFPDESIARGGILESSAVLGIPENLEGLVQLQIEALLPEGALHIDTVADSLAMSRRSLQRRLARRGFSYSDLLSDTRANMAVRRLRNSNESIAEIAFTLGYGDASNFTRAFRHKTGSTPSQFRRYTLELS